MEKDESGDRDRGTGGGILGATLLDGQGGGRFLSLEELSQWKRSDGPLWVHLDYSGEGADRWLREESGLDPVVVKNLLHVESHPRTIPHPEGILLAFRGVNTTSGVPEDMVAVRAWLEERLLVTSRRRRMVSIRETMQVLETGRGPKTLLACLLTGMEKSISRMEKVIDAMEEVVLAREEDAITVSWNIPIQSHKDLAAIRRKIIRMKRFLVPQRDALRSLSRQTHEWINKRDLMLARENAEHTARMVDEIEELRERIYLLEDECDRRMADQMNRRAFVLTMVAFVFMPLTFMSGLFGINVEGIPLAAHPQGFWIVVTMMTVIGGGLWILFRRKGWI